MNIILSRKGFDSTSLGGGKANWMYKNKLYPIPIPENGTGVKYSDIRFSENKSYLDVMIDLKITQYTECHLDPNLGFISTKKNEKFWKNCLGQAGNSNQSLKNTNTASGAIFLFFGWFREIIKDKNGKFKYLKKLDYPTGKHIIYGYMEVEKRIDLNKDKFDDKHPHVIFKGSRYPDSNSIYLAREKCSFDKTINGSGVFNFNESLVLTEKGKSRSNWKLPERVSNSINKETKYLYSLMDNQEIKDGRIKFNTQGQEIIFENANKKIIEWSREIIKNNHT